MKIFSNLQMSALLCSLLLASCASSTMDSTPTVAELNAYEKVVRARYQPSYDDLARKRESGALSKAEYDEEKSRIDSKVAQDVNDAAWNKHFLAESERKADGVPTPDNPIALSSGQAGGSMGSFYRPSNQSFGMAAGIGGTAGIGSMNAAREQVGKGQGTRNDAMSAGGTYLSQPPPGSIYDSNVTR
ncbi:hypothetical protein [Prosthecobacter sp.]|uniref:hypothetical protein n=1 Tax=Prosthecobacter sp. TaxID=1965333 RepID=UPI001D84AF32|nr:hypothetical protein [Prosthecobacter sp.]MCB1278475.1 hypothetical protein [Prosthecobacter sp.]